MNQMILRIVHTNQYVEVLEHDNNGREYFKEIELESLIKKIKEYAKNDVQIRTPPILFDEQIIGASSNCVVINQAGRKRDVVFKDKAYLINFPNSIYIMNFEENTVRSIEAYCYIEYEREKTKLYEYAMPNMLGGNKICIGNAPITVENKDYVGALEEIIYSPYSHDTFGGLKGFLETEKYFEFLQANEFPYHLLIGMNKRLKNVI